MKLVNSLLNFLKQKDTINALAVPNGLCPNCWGREEYGGQFFERVKQEKFDINAKDANIGWINDYANKYLAGIALKRKREGEEEKVFCEKCAVGYRHSGKHTD